MNLEEALRELMKKPRSMIGANGRAHAALFYTDKTYYAIKWLVNRYNDGTLQVIGYDFQEEVRKSKLERHTYRRAEGHDLSGYMHKSRFIRETGFSTKLVDRIAREAGAILKIGHNCYININTYFHYLDHIQRTTDKSGYVNLTMASEMIGERPKVTKQLVKDGVLKANPYALEGRTYKISKKSIEDYIRRKKGAKNGKNDSDDSEVH